MLRNTMYRTRYFVEAKSDGVVSLHTIILIPKWVITPNHYAFDRFLKVSIVPLLLEKSMVILCHWKPMWHSKRAYTSLLGVSHFRTFWPLELWWTPAHDMIASSLSFFSYTFQARIASLSLLGIHFTTRHIIAYSCSLSVAKGLTLRIVEPQHKAQLFYEYKRSRPSLHII
jgi:hypothetical protein